MRPVYKSLLIMFLLAMAALAFVISQDLKREQERIAEEAANEFSFRLDVGKKGYCSGFVLSSTLAITAAHCISNKHSLDPISIIGYGDMPIQTFAFIHHYHTKPDWLTLSGNFSAFRSVAIDTLHRHNMVGRRVMICGSPAGYPFLRCHVSVISGYDGRKYLAEGLIMGGQSGGPVIDLKTGTVIGNVRGTHEQPSRQGMVIINPLIGLHW